MTMQWIVEAPIVGVGRIAWLGVLSPCEEQCGKDCYAQYPYLTTPNVDQTYMQCIEGCLGICLGTDEEALKAIASKKYEVKAKTTPSASAPAPAPAPKKPSAPAPQTPTEPTPAPATKASTSGGGAATVLLVLGGLALVGLAIAGASK